MIWDFIRLCLCFFDYGLWGTEKHNDDGVGNLEEKLKKYVQVNAAALTSSNSE